MPAYRPVRRSQLISPFGIGAMVDFPKDESLMPAGLDAWPAAKQECPPESGWLVREERLEARLGVTHLRLPPDHRDADRGVSCANVDVPFVRFPRWCYCHHCGGMEYLSIFSNTRQRCAGRLFTQQSCHGRPEKRRPFLIPVRFVAVCQKGHIQDFPFMEWVHRGQPFDFESHKLRMRAGRSSAGLSGIKIECSCGVLQSLGNAFEFDKAKNSGPLSGDEVLSFCKGLRPWLGEADSAILPCGEHLRAIQRGASNVYFPQVVSAIYLPLWAEQTDRDVIRALEDPPTWAMLSQATLNGKIDPMRCEIIAGPLRLDAAKLQAAAQRKLGGAATAANENTGTDEEDFRRSEYKALCEGRGDKRSDLFIETVALNDYEANIAQFFSRICLVHKLRETRALAGFTRLLPPDGSLTSDRLQKLKLDEAGIDWLPAIKVYGEGIFLVFDKSAVDRWFNEHPPIGRRLAPLAKHYNAARTIRGQPQRNVTAKFLLLHTLAHVLINQLSFDCGYGSASLRERLYCDFTNPNKPMQGLLIYTSSGDSEGTMGGLVRQGKPGRLESTLRRAINHASWCSSDPVCIETSGQGADNANLAACHGCALLPETSCEEGNRILDRALLVGTPDHPNLGFFKAVLGL